MGKVSSKKVYVVGHRNPDTDSICSAIAYANLKKNTTGKAFEAKRAGQLNEETQYVLNRFKVKMPRYLATVKAEVKDLDIQYMPGIDRNMSLKKAWTLMRKENSRTVPVLEGKKLEGLISITDIAESYMDIYDSRVLAKAGTLYKSVAETLEGQVVAGDENQCFTQGKVTVAASSPESMEEFIAENDIVILGNRYESQLCAIELGAQCLVLCAGAKPSKTIVKLATEHDCAIICTKYDTFTAARLVNQSIPVSYFMTGEKLTSFTMTDKVEDIQEVMTRKRYRNFPIVDKNGDYVGLISRTSIINVQKKKVILVDHNEAKQAVDGIEQAEVLEIIDHHRLGGLETAGPLFIRNQPVGCTATIVTQMYDEAGVEIDPVMAGLLCSAIISDTLMFQSPTCTAVDEATCKRLAGIAGVKVEELANGMFNAGTDFGNKSPEDVCTTDFKTFTINGKEIGVGQVNFMSDEGIDAVKDTLEQCLEKIREEKNLQMVFIMLTNIVDHYSEMIFAGEGARRLLHDAFDVDMEVKRVILKGVVSRKKQLVPVFVEALQQ